MYRCEAFEVNPLHLLLLLRMLKRLFLCLFPGVMSLECYRERTGLGMMGLDLLERCFRRVDRGEWRQTLPEGTDANIGGCFKDNALGERKVCEAVVSGHRVKSGK